MEALVLEILGVFGVLRRWGDAVHEGAPVKGARRGVLELLLRDGSETVSGLARVRGVSRQQVQHQVDRLLELGFVERLPNPAHRRAPLIGLTNRGRALIKTVRSAELDALSQLPVGVSDEAVADAAKVLAALRTALERDLASRVAARL